MFLNEVIKLDTNNKINLNTQRDYSMFEHIKLEDTGLFNYKGRQSTVYNRFTDCGIETLKDLFELDDLDEINYGNDKLVTSSHINLHIHKELKGIIALLRYKYLNEESNKLTRLFDFRIEANEKISINPYAQYGYPGDVFKSKVLSNKESNFYTKFYEILKSCGFDQTASKAILDDTHNKKIENITLGQYLSEFDINSIKTIFHKVQNEYKVFINVLSILLDYYKNVYLESKELERENNNHKSK